MIIHPAKHLFEAKFPSLEDHEEEVFFPHPVYNLKVNQLGALYCDDSEYGIYDKTGSCIVREHSTMKNCGTKLRVIWECYYGEMASNSHFLFANANPLDTRKENLILASGLSDKEREPYFSKKKKFVTESVKHLIKIEERMAKMGVEKEQLYAMLMLPYWLKSAREKNLEAPIKEERLPGSKSWTTEEEANEVEKLFLQGLSVYAILKRMNWPSTHRIKKVIRDRKLVR